MVKKSVPTKKLGGPIIQSKRKTIMNELSNIIESGQILGVTHSQLAKKYGIRRQTVADYLKEIYALVPPDEVNIVRVKIQTMYDRLFREAQTMLKDAKTPQDKRIAIELMLKMLDKFTIFLESFHIKEKATENIIIGIEKQLVVVKDSNALDVIENGEAPDKIK